jgi:hypothetical protein
MGYAKTTNTLDHISEEVSLLSYSFKNIRYKSFIKIRIDMMNCSIASMHFAVVLWFVAISFATALGNEFSIVVNEQGGLELVWSSSKNFVVRSGAARPEFRWPDGQLLGYPRERNGTQLHLIISSEMQEKLLGEDGERIEVWTAGRRIDSGAPVYDSGKFSNRNESTPTKTTEVNIFASARSAPLVPKPPTIPLNPAKRGRYRTKRLSYSLAELEIDNFDVPTEVLAEVTDAVKAKGKLPLVLFLHGRHATCYQGGPDGTDSVEWPCPDDWSTIPSYQGYRYVADTLASQGCIVVSISANGINAQDNYSLDAGAAARSQLIRHHLSLWAQWNTGSATDPWQGRFQGRLDMQQVILVGHSRGGEGVHRAAIDTDSTDPYKIVGLVSYGPTAFGRQVSPDVHSATILPTCDGDVFDLQGQAYIDASRDIAHSEALRSAVIAVGANHNYFNTEWTPGLSQAPSWDDWGETDPICGSIEGSQRLTAAEQQVVGTLYTAALIQLVVERDVTMLPLFDGSFVRPEAIGRAEVVTSAVGGSRNRILYNPEGKGQPLLQNGMHGGECLGNIHSKNYSLPQCNDGEINYYGTPHWQPLSSRPGPMALELQWQQHNATAQFAVRQAFYNMSGMDRIDVRIANDPNFRSGARFDLVISDRNGKNATLYSNMSTIASWPSLDYESGFLVIDRIHARTLRGCLRSVAQLVDLRHVRAIHLVARSIAGRVWVLDVTASQAQVRIPAVLDLPVISMETVVVPEGNGDQQYQLEISSNKPLSSPGTIWVEDFSDGRAFQVELPKGASNVVATVPFSWFGDAIFSQTSTVPEQYILVEALHGVVSGNYIVTFSTAEDEPVPTITAASKKINITSEGKSLKWTLQLSTPTAGTTLFFGVIPPTVGAELTSDDVTPTWLASLNVTAPVFPVPLSSLNLFIELRFDYGVTTANLIIPVNRDGKAKDAAEVSLQLMNGFDADDHLILTGTALSDKNRKF